MEAPFMKGQDVPMGFKVHSYWKATQVYVGP